LVDNEGYWCQTQYSSACYGAPEYKHNYRRYCILHLPTENKGGTPGRFRKTVQSKLERNDFMFAGVYFPGGIMEYFLGVTFSEEANFRKATFGKGLSWHVDIPEGAHFRGATFSKGADFFKATFSEGAYFQKATFNGEANFQKTTFNGETNFQEATFNGEANFQKATFSEEADFQEATFSEEANFSGATFSEGAHFFGATFSERAYFLGASFSKGAHFSEATFNGEAEFVQATFNGEANFRKAIVRKGAYFSEATFKERAIFYNLETSSQTAFDFTDATMEKPERISFHTTLLRPSWFVDVDAQKFDFSDVEWFKLPNKGELDEGGEELRLEDEIEALRGRGIEQVQSLRKLTKACRRLMNNAEENRDYPTANEMHYWSMEAQRKEGWSRLGLIATLYWALSGHGERPLRAFGVLVAMYAVFASLYMLLPSSPFSVLSSSDVCEYMGCIGQGATYSLSALARLLPAEPKLSPGLFQFLVTVEGLLAPLQIALLLLAVRRKVMR